MQRELHVQTAVFAQQIVAYEVHVLSAIHTLLRVSVDVLLGAVVVLQRQIVRPQIDRVLLAKVAFRLLAGHVVVIEIVHLIFVLLVVEIAGQRYLTVDVLVGQREHVLLALSIVAQILDLSVAIIVAVLVAGAVLEVLWTEIGGRSNEPFDSLRKTKSRSLEFRAD